MALRLREKQLVRSEDTRTWKAANQPFLKSRFEELLIDLWPCLFSPTYTCPLPLVERIPVSLCVAATCVLLKTSEGQSEVDTGPRK